jgi:hypothetical protein
MTIKYGELTRIKSQAIFSSFVSWFNPEYTTTNYVFLFDDGEICDLNDKLKDLKFVFLVSCASVMPLYFTKDNTYFKQDEKNDFDKLFSSYSTYDSCVIDSIYNGIYCCHKNGIKPEVFGMKRIKSSDTMPRYQFAYDTDEFTKEEIVYLIHYIFNINIFVI